MKFNFFGIFLLLSLTVFLSSCLKTADPVASSTDASFVSLKLAGNDSVKTAVFTLAADGKTIVNVDSLPYKTRVDSIFPTFSFKSTSGTKLYFPSNYKFKREIAFLSGKDTIDFKQQIRLVNYPAADTTLKKEYFVKVNVHKVQPELYVWNKLTEGIDSHNATSQKAVYFNNQILYYLNNGTESYLYSSTNGSTWSPSSTLTGFPVDIQLDDLIPFNGKLYLSKAGNGLYLSTNGSSWTNITTDANIQSLLFVLNNKLWAISKSSVDSKYYFVTNDGTDLTKWSSAIGEIPLNFPIRKFASISFASRTGKQKAVIIGGLSSTAQTLKSTWSTEGEMIALKSYWVDFSTENHTMDTLSVGASVIAYDNKLLAFGLRTIDSKVFLKQSIDEGFSWQLTNQNYNQIREYVPGISPFTQKDTVFLNYYQPHTYQSVVVDSKKRIYIIGRKTATSQFSDVWTGKLNRLSF